MYSINKARKDWKKYENKNGFITTTPEEIVENIDDFDKRNQKLDNLQRARNFYEWEWENDKQESWRFIKGE